MVSLTRTWCLYHWCSQPGQSQSGTEKNNESVATRLGLLGRKVGMMRLFTDDGDAVPVTVVDVSNNRVAQSQNPGQSMATIALQVAFGTRRLRA